MTKDAKFSDLLGVTLLRVERHGNEEIVFTAIDGRRWKLYHQDDCCESVTIESVVGNLNDLVGYPITMADESSNSDNPPASEHGPPESFTWTFYKLATIQGYVDIRWYGESNGYYSEGVDFVALDA